MRWTPSLAHPRHSSRPWKVCSCRSRHSPACRTLTVSANPLLGSGRAGAFAVFPTRPLPAAPLFRPLRPCPVYRVCRGRRFPGVALEMGCRRPHSLRDLGRADRVPRLDLPAHPAGERVTSEGGRAGLWRWFHRALSLSYDLPVRIDAACAGAPRHRRARRQCVCVHRLAPSNSARFLMPTRRPFLHSPFAPGATLPALRNDALSRILPTIRGIDGRPAADVAQDEDFWREIQAAFDIDRGMINLNNGGVAPSPRVVYAALQRYLAVSNQAPAITIWAWIEPEIETVRRRLAGKIGRASCRGRG